MAKQNGFIKYILIIIIILLVAFLSQKIMAWGNGKTYVFKPASQYLADSYNWAKGHVLQALGGEVEKRGEMVKEEINKEKEKISENISEKIKNYFSGIGQSITNPSAPRNCPDTAGQPSQ